MANTVLVCCPEAALIKKFKIKEGSAVNTGTILCEYQLPNSEKIFRLKSNYNGTVKELLLREGTETEKGSALVNIELCRHLTIWRNMCAECGLDLREQETRSASVAMEHMIPDLLISEKRAEVLGREDEERLLKNRQLVLLVDLDQTLIHTTNDTIPPNLKDVFHFQLWPYPAWYHTKFRPHTEQFLERISQLYELHICTFGTRTYAHTIAKFLDPDGRYFSQRILSRDECFHPTLKTSNLKALFPCGDSMVCIIDDREDVWKMAPNLVHVRPYRFFDGTADINAPPEASKVGVATSEYEGSDIISRVSRRSAKIVRIPRKKDLQQSVKSPAEDQSKCDTGDSGITKDDLENGGGDAQSMKSLSESEVSGPDAGNVTTQLKESIDTRESTDQPCGIVLELAVTNRNGEESVLPSGPDNVELLDSQQIETYRKDDHEMELELTNNNKDVDVVSESVEQTGMHGKELEGNDSYKTDGDLEKVECEPKNPEETTAAVESSIIQSVNLGTVEDVIGKKDDVQLKGNVIGLCDGLKSTEEPQEDVEYDEMIEWEDLDDYLIYLEDVLRRIHTAYYKVYDQMQHASSLVEEGDVRAEMPDLKTIVPYVRRKVLKGAQIVFSGVCPLDTDPTTSRIYRVATSLGAVVQSAIVMPYGDSEPTTHLVAARLGTLKVKAALRCQGIKVVNPDWLWTCADRWEWVDERLFPLTEETATHFLSRDSPVPGTGSRKKDNVTAKQDKAEVVGTTSKNAKDSQMNDASLSVGGPFCNPFSMLSKEEISGMDAEVENILDEESESDEDNGSGSKRNVSTEMHLEAGKKQLAAKESDDDEEEAKLREQVLLSF
jgi:RNA polymerase II subunit A-like phosphatase